MKPGEVPWKFSLIKNKVNLLCRSLEAVKFVHVKRSGNHAANALAKKDSSSSMNMVASL